MLSANIADMKLYAQLLLLILLNDCITDVNASPVLSHPVKKSCRDINIYQERVKCMPRPTLVELPLLPGDEEIEPSMALVDRCHGSCTNGFNCVPESESFEIIPVKTHLASCTTRNVTVHKSCECKCTKQCNERQELIEDECSCECKDEAEEEACRQKTLMEWDEDECRCKCWNENTTICTSGSKFSDTECRCVPNKTAVRTSH